VLSKEAVDKMVEGIIFNCEARVEMSDDALYEACGNGTEVGMLRFLQSNDMEISALMTKRQRESTIETNVPFGPVRKRQVVAVRPSKTHKYVRIVVKGAPEYVINSCTHQMMADGEEYVLDASERSKIIDEEVAGRCKKGLKCIMYAYKDIDVDEWDYLKETSNNFETEREILERNLVFLAFYALNDDLRTGVDEIVG
jgi:magnesium-transporting ATPase (P-type)